MANKNRMDASVECPYYVSCEGKCITCKGGLVADGITQTKFRTEAKRKEYMGHFCRRLYSLCPFVRYNDKALGFDRPDVQEVIMRDE
jgi:hypothetical protein